MSSFVTALSVPIIIGIGAVIIGWFKTRVGTGLALEIKRGEEVFVPIRVRSDSRPYPKDFATARLWRLVDGGIAVTNIGRLDRTIVVREPGLRVEGVTDKLNGVAVRADGRTAGFVTCVDSAGNQLLIKVPDTLVDSVKIACDPGTVRGSRATPTASDAPTLTDAQVLALNTKRTPFRRTVGWRWFRLALIVPAIFALTFTTSVALARTVQVTITANDGQGGCAVTYKSAFGGATKSGIESCDASAKVGQHLTAKQAFGFGANDYAHFVGLGFLLFAFASVPAVMAAVYRYRRVAGDRPDVPPTFAVVG